MHKLLKFLFVIKLHIILCAVMLGFLYISKNILQDLSVSIIFDPISIAFLTADIFYVFINKWPEFKEKIKMEITIKDALIQILKEHEAELRFFLKKENLAEMLKIIRTDINFQKKLELHKFNDVLPTIYGPRKSIEVSYIQRLEIIEKIKLILEIWSSHLSINFLTPLWYIASDKNNYLKQHKLFISLANGYPEKNLNDSLCILWERFGKDHLLFLNLITICKEIYPEENYFNTWD